MTPQNGYDTEWLANGRVLAYRFHSLGGTTADEWYTEMMLKYETWSKEKRRVLILMDIRDPDNLLSAGAMQRSRQLGEKFKDLEGRFAVLVDPTENTKNITMFIEQGMAKDGRERQIFDSEEAALAWLTGD